MIKSKIHYRLPRILAILFIVFAAFFVPDLIGARDRVSEINLVFFMHLIPSFMLIITVAIAWRWRRTGGTLFILLGVVSILFLNTYWHILTFLFVSLPPILLGLLFIREAQWHQPEMTGNHQNFHPS